MDIQTIAVVVAVLVFFIGSFILIRQAEKELAKSIRKRAEDPVEHQLNDLEKSLHRSKKRQNGKESSTTKRHQ